MTYGVLQLMPKNINAHNIVALVAIAIPFSSSALSPEEVFAKAAPSVVMVFSGDLPGKMESQGSGVLVSGDKVITNCHVIYSEHKDPRKAILVKKAGQSLPASLIASNKPYDTCLLMVPGIAGHQTTMADTTSLRVGQRVYAIGAPSGLELTLTEGLLSALRETGESKVIQTSAAISPGSSGGGLFDDQGNLIGITSFQMGTGTGLNFAYFADAIIGLVALSQRTRGVASDLTAMTDSVQAALTHALADQAPGKSSFTDSREAVKWLTEMSSRLGQKIPDRESGLEFLRAAHYEATRAGLDPQMVLGLIEVVSDFKKDAVSPTGATGYMMVMPGWVGLIGRSEDNLFHLRTNLRYGCTILRYYLDIEKGDLYRTLARYEKGMKQGPGVELEESPNARFPNMVRDTWQSKWLYALAVKADLMDDAESAYARGDFAHAIYIVRPLAEEGDARAQFRLGVMYADGIGVDKNYKEAFKWYRLAAATGNSGAQRNIGIMFELGQDVEQNYKEALKWYRMSAEKGDIEAQWRYGNMYYFGNGVAKNYEEAAM